MQNWGIGFGKNTGEKDILQKHVDVLIYDLLREEYIGI